MKITNVLKAALVLSLGMAGQGALQASEVQTIAIVKAGSEESKAPFWASACVGNLKIETPVEIEIRWGGEKAEWQKHQVEKNSYAMLMQHLPSNTRASVLAVRFVSNAETGEQTVQELRQTNTRFKPRGCDALENYHFERSEDGILSLVRAE